MKKINSTQLKQLVEATFFVADKPVTKSQLRETVLAEFAVSEKMLNETIQALILDYQPRGIQLVEIASGYRFQSLDALSPWLSVLWQESAPRYSRAMLEILALIAYRQPITRGEIEQVRGVAVSSNIIKTLTEREWIRVVGHKEVPGRPALYATTKAFLDYFSLRSLSELPSAEAFAEMVQEDDHEPGVTVQKEAPSVVMDRANVIAEDKSISTNE
ncbi:SMC-Scp complex subunit ScpB [Alteromonas pelagimontana]|uniref:SMC-Scp complex subunit ScpB n=1 Tax=Alteromonas pelagimontana TaxID=1858656 RepID=A0A6M4MB13_9ALTE|nr:SMC-Scp complex subunit ScpB [Alteromonas pelagimontana]QJR79755.1 SMC-Scp complex subunit ScpB [Alteromonas pelagimontana]